jgi:hypothetical protein
MGWVALIEGVTGAPLTMAMKTHDAIKNPKGQLTIKEHTKINKRKICTQTRYNG